MAEFTVLSAQKRKKAQAWLARWCEIADGRRNKSNQMVQLRREVQIMLLVSV